MGGLIINHIFTEELALFPSSLYNLTPRTQARNPTSVWEHSVQFSSLGAAAYWDTILSNTFLESGDATTITVFDVSTKPNRLDDPKVKYETGSITSRKDVLAALRNARTQVIFNTASPDPLVPVPKLVQEVNVKGTQNVLEFAMELGIKIHVYTSSSEVVQSSYEDLVFVGETSPLPENPVDGAVYSRTKKIGEEILLRANGKHGMHNTLTL